MWFEIQGASSKDIRPQFGTGHPEDFDAKTNNKFWQLQTVQIDCPECRERTSLTLPTVREAGKVLLYGDDAHRSNAHGAVFCFSLVGGSYPLVARFQRDFTTMKAKYEPALDPSDWKLHMKDLHSGHNRRTHPVFASWGRPKVEQFVNDLFSLIAAHSDDVFTFSVSFSAAPGGPNCDAKRDCYIALLADVIYGFSKTGYTPILQFDSEKRFSGLGPIVHGWARDAFQGTQRELVYSYISHGLPVPEPLFVQPASYPCLEVADFVSFVVARGHHCQMMGKQSEYPTERLGRVFYSWLRRDGNYGRERLVGFPWHEIYEL